MTLNEWLVTGLGLAAGWAIVSFLFRSSGGQPREAWQHAAELAAVQGTDAVDWWRVLGVEKTASAADIQAAYKQRESQLAADASTIETAPERQRREQLLAVLKHACERGLMLASATND